MFVGTLAAAAAADRLPLLWRVSDVASGREPSADGGVGARLTRDLTRKQPPRCLLPQPYGVGTLLVARAEKRLTSLQYTTDAPASQ